MNQIHCSIPSADTCVGEQLVPNKFRPAATVCNSGVYFEKPPRQPLSLHFSLANTPFFENYRGLTAGRPGRRTDGAGYNLYFLTSQGEGEEIVRSEILMHVGVIVLVYLRKGLKCQ